MKTKWRDAVLRIIDANLNRSREGLRVCEEIMRFAVASQSITRELKNIRHSISGMVKEISAGSGPLCAYRDSRNDILRCSRLESEMRRISISDIWLANMERVKESLRVLEELSKLIDARYSSRFSRLRFRVYDVEKKVIDKGLCK